MRFPPEERKNSSDLSFDSSEVSFDSSEVSFDSSEVFSHSSLEIFYFPVSYSGIASEELAVDEIGGARSEVG